MSNERYSLIQRIDDIIDRRVYQYMNSYEASVSDTELIIDLVNLKSEEIAKLKAETEELRNWKFTNECTISVLKAENAELRRRFPKNANYIDINNRCNELKAENERLKYKSSPIDDEYIDEVLALLENGCHVVCGVQDGEFYTLHDNEHITHIVKGFIRLPIKTKLNLK